MNVRFITDEGRVYGSRYYTVKPEFENWWDNGEWDDMVKWCVETFGPTELIWGEVNYASTNLQRWYVNNAVFWFKQESDRLLFILRWS